jgi:hypothetical protein
MKLTQLLQDRNDVVVQLQLDGSACDDVVVTRSDLRDWLTSWCTIIDAAHPNSNFGNRHKRQQEEVCMLTGELGRFHKHMLEDIAKLEAAIKALPAAGALNASFAIMLKREVYRRRLSIAHMVSPPPP